MQLLERRLPHDRPAPGLLHRCQRLPQRSVLQHDALRGQEHRCPHADWTMRKTPVLLLAAGLMTAASSGGLVPREASADGRCHRIDDDAGLQSNATTDGCTTPLALFTAGAFKPHPPLRLTPPSPPPAL